MTTEDKPTTPDAFDPAAVQIERHRSSVTQGETSVFYRGELLGRFGDDIVLCTGGSNGREPHPHGDGASCFGGFHGRPDSYWIDAADKTIAARSNLLRCTCCRKAKPPTEVGCGGRCLACLGQTSDAQATPEPAGETFEQQASEDGGRNWRTVAVGLDAADIAGARERDAAGEGRRWRFLPETDNGAARLIAAKEAQLVATRNEFDANAARTVGGRSRTKQFGRRVDAQLRRAGQLHREVERLESEIRGLRRRASEPEPPPLDLNRLPYARLIRTKACWYEVVKVNAKSVKVVVDPGWDDRIPVSRIVEIRERDDAPAAEPDNQADTAAQPDDGRHWLWREGWVWGRLADREWLRVPGSIQHAPPLPADKAAVPPPQDPSSGLVLARVREEGHPAGMRVYRVLEMDSPAPYVSGWAAHATNSEANA